MSVSEEMLVACFKGLSNMGLEPPDLDAVRMVVEAENKDAETIRQILESRSALKQDTNLSLIDLGILFVAVISLHCPEQTSTDPQATTNEEKALDHIRNNLSPILEGVGWDTSRFISSIDDAP